VDGQGNQGTEYSERIQKRTSIASVISGGGSPFSKEVATSPQEGGIATPGENEEISVLRPKGVISNEELAAMLTSSRDDAGLTHDRLRPVGSLRDKRNNQISDGGKVKKRVSNTAVSGEAGTYPMASFNLPMNPLGNSKNF